MRDTSKTEKRDYFINYVVSKKDKFLFLHNSVVLLSMKLQAFKKLSFLKGLISYFKLLWNMKLRRRYSYKVVNQNHDYYGQKHCKVTDGRTYL